MHTRFSFRILISLCVAMYVLCMNASVYAQTVYRTYELEIPNEEIVRTYCISTFDGGQLLAVTSHNGVFTSRQLSLIKMTAAGTVQWHQRFDTVIYTFHNVVQCSDSGFFISATNGHTSPSMHLIKIDKNGGFVYHKLTHITGYYYQDRPFSFAKNDNGVYVGCVIRNAPTVEESWQIFELDAGGNIVWSNHYHESSQTMRLEDIDTCANGDLIVLGTKYNTVYGEPMIDRITPAGVLVWNKIFSHSMINLRTNCLKRTGGDQFYIATHYSTGAISTFGRSLLKIDGQGNLLWSYQYTGLRMDEGEMAFAPNGDLCVAGNMYGTGSFLRIDTMGIFLSGRGFNGMYIHSLNTFNGGVMNMTGTNLNTDRIVCVETDANGDGCQGYDSAYVTSILPLNISTDSVSASFPMYTTALTGLVFPPLLHIAPVCNIVIGIEEAATDEIHVYPSPADQFITVSAGQENTVCELFNLQGEIVRTADFRSGPVTLYTGDLPNGIYFVRVHTGPESFAKKVIVQH